MSDTYFDLPNSPEEFGIILPDANLRRVDFTALDFETSRRAIIEYIKTYFPDRFNDFVASNGVMMLIEIVANETAKLALRSDINAMEAFLPTARTEEAVVNHLALINQKIKRQTAATVDIEATVGSPASTDIRIPARTRFQVIGVDSKPVEYEIFKAPGDWEGDIVIPAGKRGVICYGVEGRFSSILEVSSDGSANQIYEVDQPNVLEFPIFVTIRGSSFVDEWKVVQDPIERYGSDDKVVEVQFIGSRVTFRFGDNINGKIPLSGSRIQISYRVGGGTRGRIGVGQISEQRTLFPDPPFNAATVVTFRNISTSIGGNDKESLEAAKKRAPRDFAIQRSIVSAEDYSQAAISFSHPVYGSIVKAIATVRTEINANLVEVYCLAEGPDGIPVVASTGLKTALQSFYTSLNVLTDYVEIRDGSIKPIDLEANIIVDRNVDATVIKAKVEDAIRSFFEISNWDLGKPFYLSSLIESIELIDGIARVDIFNPSDNILAARPNEQAPNKVQFYELITLGNQVINYYYDRVRT